MYQHWKKGRGKLGLLQPLLGDWVAEGNSPAGPFICTRSFKRVLEGKYIRLEALWQLSGRRYEEIAMIGDDHGQLCFWSYTSDGKRSQGHLSSAREIHPDAICFEAQMPAGLARMIYWPRETEGFFWAVESKSQKGWNRFTLHEYLPEILS